MNGREITGAATLRKVLISGPFITFAAAVALEVLARTPLFIPNPAVILILAVVYAA